jgi:four helix bundle protein
MTYQAFEDLPVWKEAILLVEEVYQVTTQSTFRAPASFKSQIERAALSVSNNVAEGFERGTKEELISFLYIARGSAGETRSMLRLLSRNKQWGGDPTKAISLALSCSKQIGSWAQYLQETDIKGQRHLNKQSRDEDAMRKKAAALQKRLLQNLPENHPLRREARQRELDAQAERRNTGI